MITSNKSLNNQVVVAKSLLVRLASKHLYTYTHGFNVEKYARTLATYAVPHWSNQDMECLALGARLHDIGKLFTSNIILNGTGKLTNEQFAEIKKHPVNGSHILTQAAIFSRITLDSVLYHHESYNRNCDGYPGLLWGEDIPIAARIVSVCDVFDALTSARSYKPGFSFDRASRILREESGKKLDPLLVEMFLTYNIAVAA